MRCDMFVHDWSTLSMKVSIDGFLFGQNQFALQIVAETILAPAFMLQVYSVQVYKCKR